MGSPTLKNDPVRKLLAKNVKAMLRHNEWSENELARRTGTNPQSQVSQKQINNLTHVRTGTGVDAIAAIAHAFNVPAWMLLLPNLEDVLPDHTKLARIVREYRGTEAAA